MPAKDQVGQITVRRHVDGVGQRGEREKVIARPVHALRREGHDDRVQVAPGADQEEPEHEHRGRDGDGDDAVVPKGVVELNENEHMRSRETYEGPPSLF